MSATNPIPSTQIWLLERRKILGYPHDALGLCQGIAHAAKQAILADEMETFNQRLQLVRDIPSAHFCETIESAKRKNPKTQRDTLTASIPAFFDLVELYQQASLYPELFERGKAPKTQHDFSFFPAPVYSALVLSDKLAGGIHAFDAFSGAYDKITLKMTLQSLVDVVISNSMLPSNPIAFVMNSTHHAIAIGYHPTQKQWHFIDANQLPALKINDIDTLTKKIIQAFSSNGIAIFSTQMHTLEAEKVLLENYKQWICAFKTFHHMAGSLRLDSFGASLLHVAAQKGQVDIITALRKIGANFYAAKTDDGITPLILAAQNGHFDTVTALLSIGVDVNAARTDGASPLILAARNGRLDTVTALLNNGADVNSAALDGTSPLILAAHNGYLDIVMALLNSGADVNLARMDGANPLILAAQNGHLDTVTALLNNGADVNSAALDGTSPLILSAQNGHFDTVTALLNNGADVNASKTDGANPLILAAQNGHLDTVTALLNNGADVNAASRAGISPLMLAAQNGHLDMVMALLNNDADVNAAALDGITPLMLAAQNGHLDTVMALLNSGAGVNAATLDGICPLMLAAQNGHLDTVTVLLNNGADVNAAKSDGTAALILATLNGHYEIVNLLLTHHANPELKLTCAATDLKALAGEKNADVQNNMNVFIMARQKSGESESSISMTPWQIACILNHKEILACFREQGKAPCRFDDTLIDALNRHISFRAGRSSYAASSSSPALFHPSSTDRHNIAKDLYFLYVCFGEWGDNLIALLPDASQEAGKNLLSTLPDAPQSSPFSKSI